MINVVHDTTHDRCGKRVLKRAFDSASAGRTGTTALLSPSPSGCIALRAGHVLLTGLVFI